MHQQLVVAEQATLPRHSSSTPIPPPRAPVQTHQMLRGCGLRKISFAHRRYQNSNFKFAEPAINECSVSKSEGRSPQFINIRSVDDVFPAWADMACTKKSARRVAIRCAAAAHVYHDSAKCGELEISSPLYYTHVITAKLRCQFP